MRSAKGETYRRVGVGRVGVGPPAFFNRYRARARYRASLSVRGSGFGGRGNVGACYVGPPAFFNRARYRDRARLSVQRSAFSV